MKIILVRHGETEYPLNNGVRLTYGPEAPLTPNGRSDIFRLGSDLRGRGVHTHTIYTSTYKRAVETAEILSSLLGISDIRKMYSLRDVDTPEFIGKPVGTTPQDYYASPLPDTHETLGQLTTRAVNEFDKIVTQYAHNTLLIVGHRDFLLALVYAKEQGKAPISLEELVNTRQLERGDALLFNLNGGGFVFESAITASSRSLEGRRKSKEQ